ncbi:Wzz/FepE/Etk N-terminal domain-containing protein [Marinomonas sp. RSW2]|uniref:Wzz/FepE/Etk N-terminal domain-containing protein n=1 Tax=Marinomonas maritima TaxID=2940935 RepID=A0ABT5WA98_9GAMM|nr:Wzz/FepE/Etk N-terminal domain-containing protein [Marinomonas maritima]MDE8601747.1 Wzz/FepE/Etk N-terminal domain-containing protein [Marinomonas maritima]
MTKGQLSPDQFEQKSVLEKYQFDHQDDEIDLKELVVALWQGKITIIAVTVICAAIAIAYALLVKEKWTTETVVTAPQISDYSAYQKMVNNFQPVFDIYQGDGALLVSNKLDGFLLSKNLFQIFIQQYQSRANKKAYISSSSDFQAELTVLQKDMKEEDYKNAEAKLYGEWYQKLTENVATTKSGIESYTLQGIQHTAEKSFGFLNGYVGYIEMKAQNIALANLKSAVEGKHSELGQQKALLVDQAKSRLKSEQELAKYALKIAQAAGVSQPQQNLGNQELFVINIGSNALEAKVKVLDSLSLNQLNIIDPRLQVVDSKLNLLGSLKIDSTVSFQTFRYIESPEKPLGRTSPKRSLIAILGALLGGMLGCFLVLIRFALREK